MARLPLDTGVRSRNLGSNFLTITFDYEKELCNGGLSQESGKLPQSESSSCLSDSKYCRPSFFREIAAGRMVVRCGIVQNKSTVKLSFLEKYQNV